MDGNKPHVVIFGAGMTGRGHIAQLAFESGWKITFVDKDRDLVKLLNDAGSYTVHLISADPRDVAISGYDALHIDDGISVTEAIANADMVITAVLAGNLPSVAPVLAEGLRLRLMDEKEPSLNIIAAENINEGSSRLWILTSCYLSFREQQRYGLDYGFPNSMIARVVPVSSDPLFIPAEDYNEWTADALACVGDPPYLEGLEWVSNQEARLKRKLYIHNTGHAVCAYLGSLLGYEFIHEAGRDEWIMSQVKTALDESGHAISAEFGFDEQEIRDYAQSMMDRLPDDSLPDRIERVIREPIRKLGAYDRFFGPLQLCFKHGLSRDGLCLGIAAVLASQSKDDEGLMLTATIKKKGATDALLEVSDYTPDAESVKSIEKHYSALISDSFSLTRRSLDKKPKTVSDSKPVWDILGFGIVAVDDLLVVDNYPPPDAKMPVLEKRRQGGGLTGTAIVAASRLGAKCAYGGMIGESELSNWMFEELSGEGIDCSPAIRCPESQPYHSIIIVDRTHHTRNIFYSGDGVMARPPETIDEAFISKARVVFIDNLGIDSMLRAATIAKRLGIPTVADIERHNHPKTDELLAQIEHLILSASFAETQTGTSDPVKQLEILHKDSGRACTAITVGIDGCWYIYKEKPDEIQHQPAFKVKVVDTTGCGDVFHGAYAAGIAWGWSVPECMRFASATAALKATKPGGRAGIPDRAGVEKFLKEAENV